MLRMGAKLPGYFQLQVTSIPRNKFIRLTSSKVCEPIRPPCLPPPKKKSRLRRILGGALLVGAGTLLYAKYDDDFRQTLVCYVPWTDSILKFIFQEEKSYQDSIKSWFGIRTESLPEDAAKGAEDKSKSKPPEPVKKKWEGCEPGADKSEFDDDGKTVKPVAQSIGVLRSSCSFEELTNLRTAVEAETNLIIEAYADMKEVLTRDCEEAAKFVDDTAEILEPEILSLYLEKFGKLPEKINEIEKNINVCKKKINDVRIRMRDCKFDGPKDLIDKEKKRIDECTKIANNAGRVVNDDRLIKSLCDRALEKLSMNRVQLLEEVNALFPKLNIPERITILDQQEVDLFLVYTAIQVDQYRDAVKSIQSSRDSKIMRTLCQVNPEEAEGKTITNEINARVSAKQKEAADKTQKRVLALKKQCEEEVGRQLGRQTAVHLASLKEIQAQRVEKLREQYSEEFEKAVREIKEKNAGSVKQMRLELKELDELFRARTDKDFCAHRCQLLWAAGMAIIKAINQYMPFTPPKEKLVKLEQEISDVVKSSVEGDDLVTCVVRTFPESASNRGVFTREALIERFDQVAKVALMTSIVPEDGGTLPLYFLSWLQSWFLNTRPDITPSSMKHIYHSSPGKPIQLENYEIVKEARYWLERGDLLQAAKYMNALEGYSRKVASSWLCEVQRHLETQQAAEIIMAHAVAKGML